MKRANLLVEVGTEELPPKSLKALSQSLQLNFVKQLDTEGFSFGSVQPYATPRRLAFVVKDLQEKLEDKSIQKRGPSVEVAFDQEGNPTKAAKGWAKSNGISVEEAEILETTKGKWLNTTVHQEGKNIDSLIAPMLEKALKALPIPKLMRWGDSEAQFVRPVHSVCILFGDRLLDATLFGVKSGKTVLGHRFHGERKICLEHCDDYEGHLKANYVIANFEKRQQLIHNGLVEKAKALDAELVTDAELLEEVTSLVEWPVILQATFDAKFLLVPKEALIYTMKDDQRYFPLLDKGGELKPLFLFVSNIESTNSDLVVSGNERVVRPRLADAEFFFETDKKIDFETRIESLKSIVFQKKLGSLFDKVERTVNLTALLSEKLSANKQNALKIAQLCKADLVSNMVLEFPAVQGVMGKYYAQLAGENDTVALGIEEHYKPRFANDTLPTSPEAAVVAIADKIDLIVGIFGIGQIPKGDKDPFALRRAAIGVIRICLDKEFDLPTNIFVEYAQQFYGDKIDSSRIIEQVTAFFTARLKVFLVDQGYSPNLVQAVLNCCPYSILESSHRVKEFSAFVQDNHASFEQLIALHKRVANIIRKSDSIKDADCDKSLFVEQQESDLFSAFGSAKSKASTHEKEGDFSQALVELTAIRPFLADFFDNVMVNVEDKQVRNNRISLLNAINKLLTTYVDFDAL